MSKEFYASEAQALVKWHLLARKHMPEFDDSVAKFNRGSDLLDLDFGVSFRRHRLTVELSDHELSEVTKGDGLGDFKLDFEVIFGLCWYFGYCYEHEAQTSTVVTVPLTSPFHEMPSGSSRIICWPETGTASVQGRIQQYAGIGFSSPTTEGFLKLENSQPQETPKREIGLLSGASSPNDVCGNPPAVETIQDILVVLGNPILCMGTLDVQQRKFRLRNSDTSRVTTRGAREERKEV
ncbi:hypothetical protein FB451DRAFT_1529678 [Mycena latifolia]|nr:hypothetical protein FB451DRAFT_1529678 [Mycena latifolia]